METKYRVGLIVPSSNVTMEAEIPALLERRRGSGGGRFTLHSSRMRMRYVTPEKLREMDAQAERCVVELADAECDVIVYACLIGVMAQGVGYHRQAEERLTTLAQKASGKGHVISSAGALVRGIQALEADSIAIVTPYVPSLTDLVIDYLQAEGIKVVDAVSLQVQDNADVACIDSATLQRAYQELDLSGADALVLSACVQMPSLELVATVERDAHIPVLTAATASTHGLLSALGLEPKVPEAGQLLALDTRQEDAVGV